MAGCRASWCNPKRLHLGTSKSGPADPFFRAGGAGRVSKDNPTLADAILDRLIHNSYRLALKGESMRKQKTAASNPKNAKDH